MTAKLVSLLVSPIHFSVKLLTRYGYLVFYYDLKNCDFQIPHILRLGDGTEKSSGKIKPIEKIKALDSKPGFYTNHKSIIDKDKKSLEKLIKNIQGKPSLFNY